MASYVKINYWIIMLHIIIVYSKSEPCCYDLVPRARYIFFKILLYGVKYSFDELFDVPLKFVSVVQTLLALSMHGSVVNIIYL